VITTSRAATARALQPRPHLQPEVKHETFQARSGGVLPRSGPIGRPITGSPIGRRTEPVAPETPAPLMSSPRLGPRPPPGRGRPPAPGRRHQHCFRRSWHRKCFRSTPIRRLVLRRVPSASSRPRVQHPGHPPTILAHGRVRPGTGPAAVHQSLGLEGASRQHSPLSHPGLPRGYAHRSRRKL